MNDMKIRGALSDYQLMEFSPAQTALASEPWEVLMVDGRVKVLVQYRHGEVEDLLKIKRCLELLLKTENTTSGKENTEETAHRG